MAHFYRGFREFDGNHAPLPPFELNKDSLHARELIAWWPMGHGPGVGEIKDFSGKRNHATRQASASIVVGDYRMSALELTRASLDYASVNSNSIWNFTAYTMSCWYVNSFNNDRGALLSQWGAAGAGNAAWLMEILNTNFRFGNHNGSASSLLTTSGDVVTTNTLSHVVFSWHGGTSGTNAFVYFNGEQIFSGTLTVGCQDSNYTVAIGREAGTGDDWIDGRIMDMRVWNRGMGAGERHALYNPDTRWDLYYEIGRRTIYTVPAVGGILPQMIQQGLYASG